MTQKLKQTPLAPMHAQYRARMVAFHGWSMPLFYAATGMLAEHRLTRTAASLFDISHMGQLRLVGRDRAANLERLVPVRMSKLRIGDNKYTFMLNEKGGIIDDMIVGNDRGAIFIVCNASRKKAVCDHIAAQLEGDCQLQVIEDNALIAIQGPEAARIYDIVDETLAELTFMKSKWIRINGSKCRVTRGGYTGEDGFEVAVPKEGALPFAELMLEALNCRPAGLGARDTLRLEAGLCLYGNDLSPKVSPVEAGLGWAIAKSARKDACFVGSEVVLDQLANGTARKHVGIAVDGKVPLRAGAELLVAGRRVGKVTSGTFSPQLGRPIALGYVKAEHVGIDTPLKAVVRDKEIECKVTKLPFVPHRYVHKPKGGGPR